MTTDTLNKVQDAERINDTRKMAIRFEKAFGLKADTLMRMQSAHELAEARAVGGVIGALSP